MEMKLKIKERLKKRIKDTKVIKVVIITLEIKKELKVSNWFWYLIHLICSGQQDDSSDDDEDVYDTDSFVAYA